MQEKRMEGGSRIGNECHEPTPFPKPDHVDIEQTLLDLQGEGIWGFPITRFTDGKISHPDTYTDYKNNPTSPVLKYYIFRYKSANGIAVIAGVNSLCCIDFDLKNTTDKDLFERWKALIDPEILERCYIEKTRSGGYHVFFFCDGFQYDALPAANEEGRAVIEFFYKQNKIIYTFPTPGYTEERNSLYDTGRLTRQEALILLQTAELFNCYKGKKASYTPGSFKKLEYPKDKKNLFQDFDYHVDSNELMHWFSKQTRWKYEFNERRNEYELWHPHTSVKARSAVYFTKSNRMIVFSESQKLFPSWSAYDEKNPTPYIITPTHILYSLADQDFAEVERLIPSLMPPKLSFKVKKWLLSYIEKDYIKSTAYKLGQKKICGSSNYIIKVDSYLLVYLMHLIDPEYTWTCEGYYDEYFSNDECKDVIPPNTLVSHAFGHSLFVYKDFRYPITFDA